MIFFSTSKTFPEAEVASSTCSWTAVQRSEIYLGFQSSSFSLVTKKTNWVRLIWSWSDPKVPGGSEMFGFVSQTRNFSRNLFRILEAFPEESTHAITDDRALAFQTSEQLVKTSCLTLPVCLAPCFALTSCRNLWLLTSSTTFSQILRVQALNLQQAGPWASCFPDFVSLTPWNLSSSLQEHTASLRVRLPDYLTCISACV